MRPLVGAAVFLAVLLLANVVGGGVFLVLWPALRPADETGEIVAGIAVGIVSVACAYFFVVGAMQQIPRWLDRRKS